MAIVRQVVFDPKGGNLWYQPRTGPRTRCASSGTDLGCRVRRPADDESGGRRCEGGVRPDNGGREGELSWLSAYAPAMP
eukprot:1549486-Rhodomonas_salina.5